MRDHRQLRHILGVLSIGPKFGVKTLLQNMVKIANLKPLEEPIYPELHEIGASFPPCPGICSICYKPRGTFRCGGVQRPITILLGSYVSLSTDQLTSPRHTEIFRHVLDRYRQGTGRKQASFNASRWYARILRLELLKCFLVGFPFSISGIVCSPHAVSGVCLVPPWKSEKPLFRRSPYRWTCKQSDVFFVKCTAEPNFTITCRHLCLSRALEPVEPQFR
jgi:hypothetical protein